MQRITCFVLVATLFFPLAVFAENSEAVSIERGRYLVKIAGCNDCHTPGYGMLNGQVPESQWLTGDVVGWKGPWGTTYSTNLRILFSSLSEQDWITFVRTGQARPPMPWYVLKQMTEVDLRSLYRFIRSLGAAGGKAPEYLAPGKEPVQPFIEFPPLPPGNSVMR